jgi:hypothetical protein
MLVGPGMKTGFCMDIGQLPERSPRKPTPRDQCAQFFRKDFSLSQSHAIPQSSQ